MEPINILAGPVHSGKTTQLIAWVKYHRNAGGILAPVINNLRYLFSILSNDYRKLDVGDEPVPENDQIKIGKFVFIESTFEWAREELRMTMNKKPPYLIIDEIGPLELSGKGLEPMVSTIINEYERSSKNHVILVVRDHLLESVITHYNLQDQVITDHNFLSTP